MHASPHTVLQLQMAFQVSTRKQLSPLLPPLASKICGKGTEYSLYLLKSTAGGHGLLQN